MADPLSIAVSILTVLSATGSVGKFLNEILQLRNAPDTLLFLNNELVDLHLLIQRVHDLLDQQSNLSDGPPDPGLMRSLEKIQLLLRRFEDVVAYDLTAVRSRSDRLQLDKSRWLRLKSTVQSLLDDVRACKTDLALAVGILTSSTSFQTSLQVHRTSTSVEGLHIGLLRARDAIEDQQRTMNGHFNSIVNRQQFLENSLGRVNTFIDRRRDKDLEFEQNLGALTLMVREGLEHHHRQEQDIAKVKRSLMTVTTRSEARKITYSLKELSTQCHHQEKALKHIAQNLPTTGSPSQSDLAAVFPTHPSPILGPLTYNDDLDHPLQPKKPMLNHPTVIELTQKLCDSTCCCACHGRNSFRSPNFLNAVLGSLYVTYQASPWYTSACNSFTCRRRSAQMRYSYAFPQWILKRVVLMNVEYQRSQGPELILKMMKIRSPEDNIFQWMDDSRSKEQYVPQIKMLLDIGAVSVRDVSPTGQTGLHFALERRKFRLAELLIRNGADLHYEDEFGESPYSMIWSLALALRKTPSWLSDLLRVYFWDQTCLEILRFSDLHRAYFGLSGRKFSEMLSATPRSEIDQVDANGKSVLSWACVRGDGDAVAKLLLCGANPDVSDRRGKTSLHWAAIGTDTECMRHLFDAKANLEARNCNGSTPLMLAALNDALGSLKFLLAIGADIHACDDDGWTTLHCAAQVGSMRCIDYLVHTGAMINARDTNNNIAIDIAIYHHSHNAFRFLLGSFDADMIHQLGLEILERVAMHGDGEILRILREANVVVVNSELEMQDAANALAVAIERRDGNKNWASANLMIPDEDPIRWFEAFQILYDAIVNRQNERIQDVTQEGSQDSDLFLEDSGWDTEGESEVEDEVEWQDALEEPEDDR